MGMQAKQHTNFETLSSNMAMCIVVLGWFRSEYEIGGLAGHFGVPQSVDSLEDTGDIDQLRGLNEEYVASRGPKSASATMGFG